MIVFRYLNQEVQRAFAAILAVLFLIFFSQRLVYYFRDIGDGELRLLAVFQLLLFYLPVLASLLLPLTLFLAIVLAFGRLYVEQEMTVLHATGVSERDLLRNLMKSVLVLTAVTAVVTLFITPWSLSKQQDVLAEESAQADFNLLSPGRFQNPGRGNSVVYVREQNADDQIGGVFFATIAESPKTENSQQTESNQPVTAANVEGNRTQIVSAQGGHYWQNEVDGSRYLVLENGWQYRVTPGSADWTVVKFERYFMRLDSGSARATRRKTMALSTWELLSDMTSEKMAEFQWRISVPLMMPVLALLAIPYCRVKPREGKFARVLPGLFIYIAYAATLMYTRSAIEAGKWPSWLGLWPIHLAVAAYGWYLLVQSERVIKRKA